FEDASRDSIFVDKGRSTYDWSPRFEHGFSQIVDWFWKIDDLKNTSQARAIFGTENVDAYGMLVIGRDAFLSSVDRARLTWRLNKVIIDSHKVICITFDQLARDLRGRINLYTVLYREEAEAEPEREPEA
ncbi:MAG: Shedu anti-phage system protein SduA domain-containing protein, partial [Syntrophobacteraceae bacterium]